MVASLDYFLPYQLAWLKADGPFVLGEKSRRVGWTYASSYRAVERRVRGLSNLYFTSADISAAKEFIEYCKEWAKVFNVVAVDTTEAEVIEDEEILTQVLTFANGKKIVAGSSNPKFYRSKGGDADADEIAFHRDPRELLKAAQPASIFWGYPLRVWSTHNGEGNLFAKLAKAGRKWMALREGGETENYQGLRLEVQTVTIFDAVEQGIVEVIRQKKEKLHSRPAPDKKARQEWLDLIRGTCPDEDAWNEEYLCRPSGEESTLLTYNLITACEDAGLELHEIKTLPTAGRFFAGYDVGRTQDLSTLWVWELVGDVYVTRIWKNYPRTNYTAQEDNLNLLMKNPAVRRLCIDKGLIGGMLAERLEDRFPTRAEGVQFGVGTMSDIAMPMLRAFQDRRVRIPADPIVRESFHKIRKRVVANNVRFEAPSDKDGHADEFWAAGLGLLAADDLKIPLPASRATRPVGW